MISLYLILMDGKILLYRVFYLFDKMKFNDKYQSKLHMEVFSISDILKTMGN